MTRPNLIDHFRADVRKRPGRIGEVAKGTGIAIKTLRKILYRETENPRFDKVEKLSRFYDWRW